MRRDEHQKISHQPNPFVSGARRDYCTLVACVTVRLLSLFQSPQLPQVLVSGGADRLSAKQKKIDSNESKDLRRDRSSSQPSSDRTAASQSGAELRSAASSDTRPDEAASLAVPKMKIAERTAVGAWGSESKVKVSPYKCFVLPCVTTPSIINSPVSRPSGGATRRRRPTAPRRRRARTAGTKTAAEARPADARS